MIQVAGIGFRAVTRLRVPRLYSLGFRDTEGKRPSAANKRPSDDSEGARRQEIDDDGTKVPLDTELGGGTRRPSADQFARMLGLDGAGGRAARFIQERERRSAGSGRELQRQVLEATFASIPPMRNDPRRSSAQRDTSKARWRRDPGGIWWRERVGPSPTPSGGVPATCGGKPVPADAQSFLPKDPLLAADPRRWFAVSPGRRRPRAGPGGRRGPHRDGVGAGSARRAQPGPGLLGRSVLR